MRGGGTATLWFWGVAGVVLATGCAGTSHHKGLPTASNAPDREGEPASLSLVSAPQGGHINEPLPSLRLDANLPGPLTAATVRVELANNDTDAVLSGATRKQTSGGEVVFNDLTVDRAGSTYTLRATLGGVSVTTPPFEVLPRYAESYYVDSVDGDDSNDGLSPDHPFATLSALPPIQPYTAIYLKRGSHWREQLSTHADHVGVFAYGNGPMPIIDASTVVPKSTFSLSPGTAQTWQFWWRPAYDQRSDRFVVYEDGVAMRRMATAQEVETTPGSFFAPTPDGSTGNYLIKIHPSDSSDPGKNASTYEITDRKKALVVGDYAVIRGIHTRRNIHDDGSFVAGVGVDIDGMIVEDGNWHNCVIASGTVRHLYAWKIENGGPYGAGSMVEFYSKRAAGRHIAIIDSAAITELDPRIPDQQAAGFGAHTPHGATPGWRDITIEGSTCLGCYGGFPSGMAQSRTYVDNYVASSVVPSVLFPATGSTDNIVAGNRCYAHEPGYTAGRMVDVGGAGARVEDNWLTTSRGAIVNWLGGRLVLRRNLLATFDPHNTVRALVGTNGTSDIALQGNLFYQMPLAYLLATSPRMATQMDDNDFAGVRRWYVDGQTYYSLSQVQAGAGTDQHSRSQDPADAGVPSAGDIQAAGQRTTLDDDAHLQPRTQGGGGATPTWKLTTAGWDAFLRGL